MSLPDSAEDEPANALYFGAAVACFVALLPYVNVLILPSYVLGAVVAVWYAERKENRALSLKDGAKLGFFSAFLGTMVAGITFDLIWQLADYQLWQRQNGQMMLGIFRMFTGDATMDAMTIAMAQNEGKVFEWYVFLIQLVANAFFAGIFGTLAGLIAAKVFGKRRKPVGVI